MESNELNEAMIVLAAMAGIVNTIVESASIVAIAKAGRLADSKDVMTNCPKKRVVASCLDACAERIKPIPSDGSELVNKVGSICYEVTSSIIAAELAMLDAKKAAATGVTQ